MSFETIPKDLKHLRACLLCSLIKSIDQFEANGCENCEEVLHLKKNREAVYDCTSSNFDGLIGLMAPEESWVAKWQKLSKMARGCYAISVTGRLPPSIISELRSQGISYKSRDMSKK